MALLSNIAVNETGGICVLTVTKYGNAVETITYTDSANQISFAARLNINISVIEFLDYVSQINIFQAAILLKHNPNVFLTVPFGSCNNTEDHNVILNKWDLVSIYGLPPRVCNYSCDIASLTVDLANRANSKTIDFPEWIYWLGKLNHYKNSLKAL